MKRKAVLVGVAVMTGLPGMAVAKGAAKGSGDAHPYVDHLPAAQTVEFVDGDRVLPMPADGGVANGAAGKASELLANIKSMLRRSNYGVATRALPDHQGWRLELLPTEAAADVASDPRLGQGKYFGLGFRYTF